jgi:hypothetical protein
MGFIQKVIALLFFTFSTASSFCQQNAFKPKKIAARELKEDFSMLRDTLQKIHAGLYRYKSKAEMDHIFDSCFNTLNDSMGVTAFYGLTRFVIASIEDGHTNSKLSRDDMNDFINNAEFFPAMVLFINNRAFILCSKQNNSLAQSELLSINDHSIHEVIKRMFNYIQSDAGIASHKNWELPENFHLLYKVLYGAEEKFMIRYKTKSGAIQTAILPADHIKNIICAQPFSKPEKYLTLEYKPGNIAVLTIRSFFDGFLEQTKENFSRFLDSAFRDIGSKKPASLIIDIRSNQGGNDDNGILLYSYLVQKPFLYYASQETVSEKFSKNEHSNLQEQQPQANSYTGKLFVLTNGRSFSGSAEFSAMVRSNQRGLFIGEECGGGYYGNTSGDEDNVTLPNSQISVRIPKVRYTMAVKKVTLTDVGIIPDFIFYNSITDIAENKDSQLEYAIKIAASK